MPNEESCQVVDGHSYEQADLVRGEPVTGEVRS